MSHPATEAQTRRRAGLTLTGVGAAAVGLLVAAAVVALAHHTTEPESSPAPARPAAVASRAGDGQVATEDALASRPMVQLPVQAALPHMMTTRTAGPAITLPQPTLSVARWIPGGFPATPEGALAQLKALDETGMEGGDPQVYARAYRELSLPGAPEPGTTGLTSVLTEFRSHAGLADTGPIPDLEMTYQVTHGLIKGSLDAGRYSVVCVLGQLSAGSQVRTVSVGVGDCQAMRWTGTEWRISPGAPAAPAPNAWPGSAEAINAGYRELS